ncbi:Uncharacterized protein APZ42_010269, partial [Daphnia magna]
QRVFVDPLVATHSIFISLEWTHSYLEVNPSPLLNRRNPLVETDERLVC